MHCRSVRIWALEAMWGLSWYGYNMNKCPSIKRGIIFLISCAYRDYIAYQGKVHSVGLIINPLFLFFPCLFIQWLHYIQILVFFSSLFQIKLFGDANHIFITLLGRRCIRFLLLRFHFSKKGHYILWPCWWLLPKQCLGGWVTSFTKSQKNCSLYCSWLSCIRNPTCIASFVL